MIRDVDWDERVTPSCVHLSGHRSAALRHGDANDPVSRRAAAVQRLYGLDHLPTEGEMEEVAERWRPYRSLAVSYLFASEFEERP